VSDVAILADPSRRYSEIYGDATVGTLDCDRLREVAGQGLRGKEDERREEQRQRECISRAKNRARVWVYVCV